MGGKTHVDRPVMHIDKHRTECQYMSRFNVWEILRLLKTAFDIIQTATINSRHNIL